MIEEPPTPEEIEEAYVQGLVVALCAVSEAHRTLAGILAEQIEQYLPPLSVELCRVEALARVAMHSEGDQL